MTYILNAFVILIVNNHGPSLYKKVRHIMLNVENQNFHFLTSSQSEMFAEIITESLRITERKHLFSWLQGNFQALLGHEIMVCAIRGKDSDTYYFDSYSSTRYFSHAHLEKATIEGEGFISKAMSEWKKSNSPVLISPSLAEGDYGMYTVPFNAEAAALRDAELINLASHGITDNEGNLSTFFSFSRLSEEVSPKHAYLLELLIPHLHCALNRITGNASKSRVSSMPTKVSRAITERESEILSWVNMGKTNWEIASILSISPLTVKNHIQNILRKLDVQNRRQAAMKAFKQGLIVDNSQ
jgi:transcriptional regulator EpsA